MGVGQVSFTRMTEEGARPDTGLSRLFKILISESAYLIWLLRNERVIQNENEKIASS